MKNKEHQKDISCKCISKTSIIISVIALLFSSCIFVKTNKNINKNNNLSIELQIKTKLMDIIKNDPQILIDAMSLGFIKKREDIIKQTSFAVEQNKTDIINCAIHLGKKNSNNSIICFLDPICDQCQNFQKNMIKIIKEKKDICFYLLPIAFLGDNSYAALYYQIKELNNINSQKLIDFILEFLKYGSSIDIALSRSKISKSTLTKFFSKANKQIEENNAIFEKLKINATPAIFLSQDGKKYEFLSDQSELTEIVNNFSIK